MKALAIGFALAVGSAQAGVCADGPSQYDAVIAKHAQANGVPETLVRRIIMRESRYNPAARNGPYFGMMQISAATARGMGYRGAPSGLLDPDVNLTYAVRYLSGAYKTAGGDHDRAVGFYARGYYYDAKRKGLLAAIGFGRDGKLSAPPAAPALPASVQLASTAQPAPVATTIPLPPMRGPVAPSPATAAASAAAPVLASATPAVPLPPMRVARETRSAPETTGSIATTRNAPTPPVRPTTAAPQQVATAVPTPPEAPKTAAPRQAAPQRPRTLTSVPAPELASSVPGAAAGAPLAFAGSEQRPAEAITLRGASTPLPPRR